MQNVSVTKDLHTSNSREWLVGTCPSTLLCMYVHTCMGTYIVIGASLSEPHLMIDELIIYFMWYGVCMYLPYYMGMYIVAPGWPFPSLVPS